MMFAKRDAVLMDVRVDIFTRDSLIWVDETREYPTDYVSSLF